MASTTDASLPGGRPPGLRAALGALSRTALGGCVALAVLAAPGAGGACAATLRDAVGRTVAVPESPRRIVSLAPNITEMLFALGLGERVAGVTDYCDWPPEAAAKPKVGGVVNPSLETVVALGADLVFATADGNRAADVDRLGSLGIPVFTIDTKSIAEVFSSLVTIGDLTGRGAEARALVAGLERRRAALAARIAGLPRVPVFVAIDRAPLISAGDGTFVGEMLLLAGGRNIAGDSPIKYPVFSLERLLAEDPAVIVDASDPAPVSAGELRASWTALPGAAGLRALRTGRLVSVGWGSFFRPGPRIMDSLERLAAMLHPEEAPR